MLIVTEIPEAIWERPFFFSVNVTHSIGDAGLYGNQTGGFLAACRGQYFASFKKFGPQGAQLIARNVAYMAANDSPTRHTVERSFSYSMMRRNLQREYAVELLALLRKAANKSGSAIEVRAHLNESIALLDAALKAQVAKVIG